MSKSIELVHTVSMSQGWYEVTLFNGRKVKVCLINKVGDLFSVEHTMSYHALATMAKYGRTKKIIA